MPYRQPWDTGHAHVHELRRAAALERARREAIAASPTSLRRAAARLVRSVSSGLGRLADGLDAHPTGHVRVSRDRRSVRTRWKSA